MTVPSSASRLRVSRKAELFVESVIREMTRVANAHGAVLCAKVPIALQLRVAAIP